MRLIQRCPECGSGDVRFEAISVRPYCADCHTWGPVNFGTAKDAIALWNAKVKIAHPSESFAPLLDNKDQK